jgi:PPK2 family polyphosphate:nucleotide phosphotransferase
MTSISAFQDAFRIAPGRRAHLERRDPADASLLPGKQACKEQVKEDGKAIDALQDRLYAEGTRALLVVLQGTDTAGKDGTVKRVFARTGPLGVTVTTFRRPSESELAHDFLWRAHHGCPRRGTIGIFNRSHYEDVLVPLVRERISARQAEARYEQINAFEKLLVENGTTILKFMLHISKAEQRRRLQDRLTEEKSRWKFDPGDIDDRLSWDAFQHAYERLLQRCSTEWAPWYVIPADRKWARNAVIAAIVRATLEDMDPRYPEVDWDPGDYSIPE